MAMNNPCSFSFVFLSLCTLLSSTSVSSSTSISYSQHCASMVPESTQTAPSTTTFPHVTPILVHYTGGDRILNNDNNISEFSLESKKLLWFVPTQKISETNTSGVYKVEAYLVFPSSGSYLQRNHRRRNSLEFAFHGFWSQNSGKLCMVGSASWYSNGGNLINLDAVLKLNYAMHLNIFSSLMTGILESLASPKDPNYFEPISLLEFGLPSSNYQYSLVSGEFDRDFRDGNDIPKWQSLGLNPGLLCSTVKRGQNEVLNLEYSNECSSSKNCSPLGKDDNNELPSEMELTSVQCSEEEQKLQYVIKFGSGYQYLAFDPTTMLVGEGSWDAKKNQLCIVACRFLNSTGSLESALIGDCSIRLSLRYPAIWTIQNRTSIEGQIWSNKTPNDSGYFHRIVFRSRYNSMFQVHGLTYRYTVANKVKKLCPFNKPVLKKGNRYPKWNSNDLAFNIAVGDSKGNQSWIYARPCFFGDQNHVLNPFFATSTSMSDRTEVEGKSTNRGPLYISYTISSYHTSSDAAIFLNSTLDISAEGLYVEETGHLCMVGCRKLSTGESMDCEILLKFQFPPVNAKKGGQIRGSIQSMREEIDPLYFKRLEITGRPFYREEAERSVWRLDSEIVMVLISNTLGCVFAGLQILYTKRNPHVLPFVSVAMPLFLMLGHMIPLVLDLGALFLGSQNSNHVLIGSGGWVHANNFVVRPLTVVAFLLQFRLLQLAFSARLGIENYKGLWVAEEKAFFVSAALHIVGLQFVLFLTPWNQNHSKAITVSSTSVHHIDSIWGNLISYGGLVLDGFLLPQILFNVFHISNQNALSHLFYIGTTCVRLLPRAYDLYLTLSYTRFQFYGAYIFANPNANFYSTIWDVVVSCGGVLFAVVIYWQQRFGGQCILPRRFREDEASENVPGVSSDH